MQAFYALERKPLENVLNKPATLDKLLNVEVAGSYSINGSQECFIGLVTLASGMKRVLFFNEHGMQMNPRESGACETRGADRYIYEVRPEAA